MPIVPATPVSRTRQQILGAPANLGRLPDAGIVGRAIGGAISSIGDVGVAITGKIKEFQVEAEENDALLATSQYTDAMTASHYDGPSAFLNRKGNAAVGAFAEGREFANAWMDDIADSLSPGAAKRFKRAANQIRANYGTALIKHVGAQTEQARTEALAAQQGSLQEAFVKSRDPVERELIATQLDFVLEAQSPGATPETVQTLQEFKDGKISGEAAINALNRGDLEDAKVILASDRGQHIEEATRIKVENGINEREHLSAVDGIFNDAIIRYPDPSQQASAESYIKSVGSKSQQEDALAMFRKWRTANNTAETAQRKAELEAGFNTIESMEDARDGGEDISATPGGLMQMGDTLSLKITDLAKREKFLRDWQDRIVNGFPAVTNQAEYSKLDVMTWEELQDEDLREYQLTRPDYQTMRKKQKQDKAEHQQRGSMVANMIFRQGLEGKDATNARRNWNNDIALFEKEHGKATTQELEGILETLRQNITQRDVPFHFDPDALTTSDIDTQYGAIPKTDRKDFEEDLGFGERGFFGGSLTTVQKARVVGAYRLFLNEQQIGIGRIAEPAKPAEVTAPDRGRPLRDEDFQSTPTAGQQ